MKPPWRWMLISSLTTAAVTIAIIGIPAWGDDRSGAETEPERGVVLPAPLPAARAELDRDVRDAVECLREHGAGPPGFERFPHGAILRRHAPAETRESARECGLPLPPPLPRAFRFDREDREDFRERLEECLQPPPRP